MLCRVHWPGVHILDDCGHRRDVQPWMSANRTRQMSSFTSTCTFVGLCASQALSNALNKTGLVRSLCRPARQARKHPSKTAHVQAMRGLAAGPNKGPVVNLLRARRANFILNRAVRGPQRHVIVTSTAVPCWGIDIRPGRLHHCACRFHSLSP